MLDAPRPFWIMAGIALLIITVPVAVRVYNPMQSVKIHAGGTDFDIGAVQQNVDAAQATIKQLMEQAEAQTKEIEQLEDRLREEQTQNQQLLAQIQKLPQAPVALKNAAVAFQEKASQPLPPITRVDPKLIAQAQQHLDLAKQATYKISAIKK